jgi:hypothetical protein
VGSPAFLFDLDGTLVDSVYQHVLAWREALDAEGIELSVWRIHRKIGMSEACSPTNRCARPRSKLIPSALNGCGGVMPRPISDTRARSTRCLA